MKEIIFTLIIFLSFPTIRLYSQWYVQYTNSNVDFRSICFIDTLTGWIAAFSQEDQYTVFRTTNGGTNWNGTFIMGVYMNTNSICFRDAYMGIIASNFPAFEWWTGDGGFNWIPTPSYTDSHFNSNTLFSGQIWACGVWENQNPPGSHNSVIRNYNIPGPQGLYLLPDSVELNRIRCIDTIVGYAVGNKGRVYSFHLNGSHSRKIINDSANFSGVSFPDASLGYIVGGQYFYKTNDSGKTYNRIFPLNVYALYRDVKFINMDTGWVSCTIGNLYPGIIKTTNGGGTWTIQWAGSINLGGPLELWFMNATTGWVLLNNNVLKTTNGGDFTVPPPPILISPKNDDTLNTLTPVLRWSEINTSVLYHVLVATDTSFSQIKDSATVDTNLHAIPSGKLHDSTIYYWKVRAISQYGSGPYSDVFHFRTFTLTHVLNQTNSEKPKEFKLYTNYPNPFNPTTKIKFDIPLRSIIKGDKGIDATLKIYDILGREVATLVNQKLQPGSYVIEFDGSNYSSGVYFYKIETSEFNDEKKMILIK